MKELLFIFVNNLLPIFLAAAVGALVSWKAKVDVRHVSKVLFYVFSPCLVFSQIINNYQPDMPFFSIAVVVFSTQVILGLLMFGLGKALRYDRDLIVAMILPVITINAGNMGMPICLFVFGDEGLAYATIFFLMSNIGTYTLGVTVASMGKKSMLHAILGVFKVPMIYSVIVAVIVIMTGWQIPLPVQRTVDILGNAAIPVMLVVLGMQLQRANLRKNLKEIFICTGARLLLSPFIVYLLTTLIGIQGLPQVTTLIQGGMPGAVTSTVVATEFDTKPEFVTSAVTVATLLSPLTLTPLIALLS